jgi:hypothetical protein
VAAIYQAHDLLDRRRADALATMDAMRPQVLDAMLRYVAHPDHRGAAPAGMADTARLAIELLPRQDRDRFLRAASIAMNKDPSPGFSLDPEWLPDPNAPGHPLLLARLQAFAADPCADLTGLIKRAGKLLMLEPDSSRRTVLALHAASLRSIIPPDVREEDIEISREICARLKAEFSPAVERLASTIKNATHESLDSRLSAYFQFQQDLRELAAKDRESFAAVVRLGLQFHEHDTRVQCARYEGTQGTRVGMTLFYTDLLAKLWQTDFGHAAPIASVPGFLAGPHIDLPVAFADEQARNPGTRIWFGPRAGAVSRLANGTHSTFLFDHLFTRIFAAGSNPVRPGADAARRGLASYSRMVESPLRRGRGL